MRFSITILSALIGGAMATPAPALAALEETSSLHQLFEKSATFCSCYPDCGCPTNTKCICQSCAPPIRPPCYPDCGCDGSAVCIVSRSPASRPKSIVAFHIAMARELTPSREFSKVEERIRLKTRWSGYKTHKKPNQQLLSVGLWCEGMLSLGKRDTVNSLPSCNAVVQFNDVAMPFAGDYGIEMCTSFYLQ